MTKKAEATVDEHPELVRLNPSLAAALMEHSPRLVIDRPALIRWSGSPTGWVVVVPDQFHRPRPA